MHLFLAAQSMQDFVSKSNKHSKKLSALVKLKINHKIKKMRKLVFIFSVFLMGFSTQGQKVEREKNAKIAFEVDGICGMCKKRIETAALKTKGIKFAIWDVKTHQLNVILNEQKTSLTTLKTNIAAAGHDIKNFKATEEAYASVHPCCMYRDSKIVIDHEGELKKQNN